MNYIEYEQLLLKNISDLIHYYICYKLYVVEHSELNGGMIKIEYDINNYINLFHGDIIWQKEYKWEELYNNELPKVNEYFDYPFNLHDFNSLFILPVTNKKNKNNTHNEYTYYKNVKKNILNLTKELFDENNKLLKIIMVQTNDCFDGLANVFFFGEKRTYLFHLCI